MKKIICLLFSMVFIILCCANVDAAGFLDESIQIDLNAIDQNQIDDLVNDILKKSKVPGASIVSE